MERTVPHRPTNDPPTITPHDALVVIFGVLSGLAVGEFFRSALGEGLLGTTVAVSMGICACLGGMIWVRQDGMEPD
jgi:hypothetical protein